MTILLTGGGTMGPVTPLVAAFRRFREMHPGVKGIWAGTPGGPERAVVAREGIGFFSIPVVKFPRYPSLAWMTLWSDYLAAKKEVKLVLDEVRPSLIVSAGGFTSVPVMRVGAARGIPCAIHQLDWEAGLSNRLVASKCQKITTSFMYASSPFRGRTVEQIATPNRFAETAMPSRDEAVSWWNFNPHRPVVFVTGGGTGALGVNDIVREAGEKLLQVAQVIHQTGAGKRATINSQGYVAHEFLQEDELRYAYAAADIVVSRAGMGALSDLAALSKPALLIPMPGSHQERNADQMPYPVIHQGNGSAAQLVSEITYYVTHPDEREELGAVGHAALPTDDGTALAECWGNLVSFSGE